MSALADRRPWIVCTYPLQGRACDVFGWQSCLAHGFGTYPHNYAAPGPPPPPRRHAIEYVWLSADHGWRAECVGCGWRGPSRFSETDAFADGVRHLDHPGQVKP